MVRPPTFFKNVACVVDADQLKPFYLYKTLERVAAGVASPNEALFGYLINIGLSLSLKHYKHSYREFSIASIIIILLFNIIIKRKKPLAIKCVLRYRFWQPGRQVANDFRPKTGTLWLFNQTKVVRPFVPKTEKVRPLIFKRFVKVCPSDPHADAFCWHYNRQKAKNRKKRTKKNKKHYKP